MFKKNLIVFDFDNTLVSTPEATDYNRNLVRQKTGYDGRGWWGRPESIDVDIFDVPVNEWVIKEYHKHKQQQEDNHIVMMTGRIPKCADNVFKILKKHELTFDEYHFTYGKRTLEFKIDKLNDYVNKYSSLERIYIYDDRTEHIPEFRRWGDVVEDTHNVEVKLYHVVGDLGYSTYELKRGQKLR